MYYKYSIDTAKTGLPSLRFPPFGYTSGNTTVTLPEMLYEIRSAIFIIPLVSVLANVSIAKTYGKRRVMYYYLKPSMRGWKEQSGGDIRISCFRKILCNR